MSEVLCPGRGSRCLRYAPERAGQGEGRRLGVGMPIAFVCYTSASRFRLNEPHATWVGERRFRVEGIQ